MKQKFSVIIPAKNAEKTINRAISSIERQDYKEYEIIVVNDHSIDGTSNIVKEIAKKDSHVRYYESKGYGVSDARNVGLLHATGDIICFCDADDYYEMGVFRVVNLLMDSSVSVVAGDYYTVSDKKNKQVKKSVPRLVRTGNLECFLNYCIANHCWELVTKFFRKDIVKKIRFRSEFDYAEDLDYFVRLSLDYRKIRCAFFDSPVYNYVEESESAMHDENRWYDDDKRLKSDKNLCAVSRYRKESFLTRVLIGKARFIISADKLIKNRRREVEINLKNNLKETWICMLICVLFGLKENIKILLRLFLYKLLGAKNIKDFLGWRKRWN